MHPSTTIVFTFQFNATNNHLHLDLNSAQFTSRTFAFQVYSPRDQSTFQLLINTCCLMTYQSFKLETLYTYNSQPYILLAFCFFRKFIFQAHSPLDHIYAIRFTQASGDVQLQVNKVRFVTNWYI